MADLEAKLEQAREAPIRLVVTDGVFSMDGDVANLPGICAAAGRHGALVMVDDSHATGFIGATGRGTAEYHGVQGRVDIISTTFGKALGGAMGGCIAARRGIIELLRQRSRPYLFSNTLAPVVAAATIEVLDMLEEDTGLRDRLQANASRFRTGIRAAGFDVRPGVTPIVPVMLGDESRATGMARRLLEEGIYVIGFSFPVVPRGQARIRVQLSALHTEQDIATALEAFTRVGQEMGVLKA
jgi:glycine C-acetyltransferase